MSEKANCKACGQEVLWAAITKKDGTPGHMPFDPSPSDKGTHQLFRKADGSNVRAEWVPPKSRKGLILRTTHFDTCPNRPSK